MMKSWRPWTNKDVNKVKEMRDAGRSTYEIAVALNRSCSAVVSAGHRFGLSKPRTSVDPRKRIAVTIAFDTEVELYEYVKNRAEEKGVTPTEYIRSLVKDDRKSTLTRKDQSWQHTQKQSLAY